MGTVGALAFVVLRLLAHDGDPTAFVHAGDQYTDTSEAGSLTVAQDSAGYDGQFSHRLARSPLSTDLRVDGIAFDRPVDRTSRIGYPALSWAASGGGHEELVPWTLIGVNVVAIGTAAGWAAVLARDAQRSSWLGLLTATWPGLLVALARDLTEPVAAAAVLAGLVLLRRQRLRWATAAMVVAALTRETSLILPLALVGVSAVHQFGGLAPARLGRIRSWIVGRDAPVGAWVGLVPIAIYAGWRAFLALAWDAPPRTGPDTPVNGLTWPLVRLIEQVGAFARSAGDPVDLLQLVQLMLVVATVALAVAATCRASAAPPHERVGLVLAVLVLVSLTTWDRAVVFLRYPTDVVVFAAALLPWADRAPVRLSAQLATPLFLTAAVVWIIVA